MHAHADTLDQAEPLGKWLTASLIVHVAGALAILAYNYIGSKSGPQFGDVNGGGIGAVAVNVVSTIPLPSRSGQVNPVANPTESRVPEPPPKVQPKPEVKPFDPDAVELKDPKTRKPSKAESAPNKYRAKQQDLPNQLYSSSGQALVSPQFGLTGAGGVGIGNNSPFGEQFGWYANLIRDKVARSWHTADIDPRLHTAPPVVVTFTINRDGSVPVSSVRVAQKSGNPALDYSAQRAILDAMPFQALPAQYPRNAADIEFVFELKR
jgi:protein TonB